MRSKPFIIPLLLLAALIITACTAPNPSVQDTTTVPTAPTINAAANQVATPDPQPPIPDPQSPAPNPRVPVPDDLHVNWLIPFDGILPIYKPEFAKAADVPFDDDELIIGVAWDGEAKAYPITVLRSREMVNDELAGIPTLVTW
jgi:hypothetical protein